MKRMVKTKIPDGFSSVRDLFGDPAGARTQDLLEITELFCGLSFSGS